MTVRRPHSPFAALVPALVLLGTFTPTAPAVAGTFPRSLLVEGAVAPEARDTGGGVERRVDLSLRLTDETGAVIHREELHCGVALVGRDERFEAVLGAAGPTGRPLELEFSDAYWLTVIECTSAEPCAGGEAGCEGTELLREPIVAHAYAFRALFAEAAEHARSADDADTVDGLHASDFLLRGEEHWVDEAGDTMTGPLELAADPAAPLEAATKQYVDGRPDETIPSGFAILGFTPAAPPGYSATGLSVLSADPWRRLANTIVPAPRMQATVVGGRLFAVTDTGRVDAYDPDLDQWTHVGQVPGRLGVVVGLGDRLHVLGGWNRDGTERDVDHRALDPATGVWETLAPLRAPRFYPAAVALNDRIHIFGGSYCDREHVAWDPGTDTWSHVADLATARERPVAAVLNGRIHLVGSD